MSTISTASLKSASALQVLSLSQKSLSEAGTFAPAKSGPTIDIRPSSTIGGDTLLSIIQGAQPTLDSDASQLESGGSSSAQQAGDPWYVSDPFLQKHYTLQGSEQNIYEWLASSVAAQGASYNGMNAQDTADLKTAIANHTLKFTLTSDIPGADFVDHETLITNSNGDVSGKWGGATYNGQAIAAYNNFSERSILTTALGYGEGTNGFLITW